jgi:predicted RNase H-like nuclease (RuvC/YqgF family)
MEIDANVYHLLNILFQALLWSLIISSPAIILTIEMYLYERYKKWKDTEIKEKEKILLGKAKNIVKQDEELERQAYEKRKLEQAVDLLKERKKMLEDELGIEEEISLGDQEEKQEEKIDINSMNIKQLKALAKEKGLTRYSRKSKKQLLKMLKDYFGE